MEKRDGQHDEEPENANFDDCTPEKMVLEKDEAPKEIERILDDENELRDCSGV